MSKLCSTGSEKGKSEIINVLIYRNVDVAYELINHYM